MMMYPQYGWGMMPHGGMMGGMGQPGMMGGYPFGAMGQGQQMPGAMTGGYPVAGGEGSFKTFDPTMMKQGRLGHYGYLEGRGRWQTRVELIAELAGPPPGYLPAGMQPQPQAPSPSHAGKAAPPVTASTAYYPMSAAQSQQGAWGDASSMPRARYDGGWLLSSRRSGLR
jgi:hypothetical protein